jgi:Phage Connector (GP10)
MPAIPKKMKNSITSWESNQLNQDTYHMYYTQLKNMAISLFKWEGLPPTVNERFLEQTLFEYGHVALVNDPVYGFLGLPSNLSGQVNMYGEPIEIMAVSSNYNKNFTVGKDSIVIYHNNLKEPGELTVRLYAQRLYEVERTIDVNIKGQKYPIVILCNEQQRMTMKQMFMQYDGNEPFIFAHKTLDLDSVKVLNTDSPYVADKLITYKHSLFNECMTKLGLSNANQDKKERLVEAEATANDEQVEAFKNGMLVQRQVAAKKINELFGLNISVDFRIQPPEKEVSDNGKVYDTDQDNN